MFIVERWHQRVTHISHTSISPAQRNVTHQVYSNTRRWSLRVELRMFALEACLPDKDGHPSRALRGSLARWFGTLGMHEYEKSGCLKRQDTRTGEGVRS